MENVLNGTGENTTPEEPTLPSDGSYSESKGVNTPKLGSGMTPIKWNGSSWVNTTGSDPEWYDYTAKKWANVKTSDGSMWVWIPRYAYSITSGYHSSSTGTIEVEFMKGTSKEGATGKTIVDYSTATANAETTHKFVEGNYVIHPAFEYGQTVSGIWVAKFEASSVEGNSDSSDGDNVTTKTLQVVPGVASWRFIEIGNIYEVCKAYNSTLNSHLMKNDEWGAVAYLSKSKYGKETEEVWINNDGGYITGSAGNSASVGQNVGTTNDYTSTQGVKASTTGTVYGIYDMSGCAAEYVAAYVNNESTYLAEYGSSLLNGEAKTKNVYEKASPADSSNTYYQNAGKYGDALFETSSDSVYPYLQSWNNDYSSFPFGNWPFCYRGGFYRDEEKAGIFAFYAWESLREWRLERQSFVPSGLGRTLMQPSIL